MAQFSISDAAFTGFGVVTRKPGAVAIWAIVQLVVSVVLSVVVLRQFGPTLQQFTNVNAAQSQDPAQTMAMFRQLAPFYAYAAVFSLIFYPILFATMNRAVLRPKDDAFGYIRVGPDELRQLGLMLIFFLLGMVAEIVLILVGAIIAGVIGGATHQIGLAPLIVFPIVLSGAIFVMVKFSLASAQTFATGKINVFGSWSLTKGRFWPVFAAYLLAFILFVIVSLLGYIIIFAVAGATGGGGDMINPFSPGHAPAPAQTTLGAMLSAPQIIRLVLGAVLSAITWPIMAMPAPAIYKAIVGDGASPADVSLERPFAAPRLPLRRSLPPAKRARQVNSLAFKAQLTVSNGHLRARTEAFALEKGGDTWPKFPLWMRRLRGCAWSAKTPAR